MSDKLRDQQRRFMLYNLLAFSLIFILFAGIVYSQIERTLMGGVREDLARARSGIEGAQEYVSRQLDAGAITRTERVWRVADSPQAQHRGEENSLFITRPAVPMRTQIVIRDSEGEVLNPHMMGRIYYEGYIGEIPFSPHELDRVELIQLSDGSQYLSSAFGTSHDSAVYYVQIIANVDGERAIVSNFFKLLSVCVAVFVLLSITASYILSRKTMAPLLTAWRRQSEFVENASHELRTPLTILQNKLEGLLTTPDATIVDKADQLGVALGETRRLAKLTADLMTLARADADEMLLEQTNFNLDELLTGLCEPYIEIAQAEDKRLILKTCFGREICADRGRVHELMVILLDNALKYTSGGDDIIVCTAPLESGVLIEVQDTGIGMSSEAAARAFDRFYREDKARSRDKGGSGLGLSIAKWIVDAHHGSITLQPGEGGGMLVQVKLR